MSRSHLETERTFELPEDAPLPELSVDGVAVAGATSRTLELHATYHDTADLALARAQVTLRRREGGEDDGWHLKLPAGGDRRREVHRALGRTSVPVPLRRALTSLTLGAPLLPVVEVRTTRRLQELRDSDRMAAVEVADDTVCVIRGADPDTATAWREIEVELKRGNESLLDQVGARLLDAGARVADHPSKLRRALGDTVPPRHVPPPRSEDSAGAALWDYLCVHAERLADREVEVRLGLADGVHQMRITARRLRSALAVCRPLLDERTSRPLEGELRWLGQELGEARDIEVMRERLLAAIDSDSEYVPARAMSSAVRSLLRADERTAKTRATDALDSPRRAQLGTALEKLLADPPFREPADSSAAKVLDRRIRRAWRRFADRVSEADSATEPTRNEALHDVRKAAKRLRYAAELATATLGAPADSLRVRAQAIQKALGDHQDSVVARGWYERLGREASTPAIGFGFGRLHALEQVRAARSEESYARAVEALRTPTSLR